MGEEKEAETEEMERVEWNRKLNRGGRRGKKPIAWQIIVIIKRVLVNFVGNEGF